MDLIILKKENIELKNVNIRSLLNEIKSSLGPKLKDKDINLKVIAEKINISVDKELMIILISNLIDNAVKASKSGDEIYLKAYIDGSLVIEVKDAGVGIPKGDIKNIFEPFYMVDKSRDRRNNGAGLGLSICAEIAKLHNARINVESELSKGSSIYIFF
jgi:signal transduction histidine kinase